MLRDLDQDRQGPDLHKHDRPSHVFCPVRLSSRVAGNKEDSLEHILLRRCARVPSFQGEYTTVYEVHEISRGEISQDSHLAQSEANVQYFSGRIDRLVDVQCIW
jgi:hypothetical protein